ncbi:MAG: four helix bundle protein [Gemmatimonadaceae bacterium]
MCTPLSTRGYSDLDVWQRAMDLAVETNRLAARLPDCEKYGLAVQIRRAAFSVPANIAEGNRRVHRRKYVQHVSVARGSLAELETGLEVMVRSSFLPQSDVTPAAELTDRVGRMLTQLLASLRA